ncbi:MAG: transposase [Lachnospiraceae bacterium]|nr:transposase [Lachnospiraceae bacterium]
MHSDALKSYNALSEEYFIDMQKYNTKVENSYLKWLHVIISNIKANIEGVYYGLDGIYLLRYLDVFCYRFNRRWSKKTCSDTYSSAVFGYHIEQLLTFVYSHYSFCFAKRKGDLVQYFIYASCRIIYEK